MPKTFKCGCSSDGSHIKLCDIHFVIVTDMYPETTKGKVTLGELKEIHLMLEAVQGDD